MKAQIVSFHCVLRDPLGKVLSSTFNQDVITHAEGVDGLRALAEGLQDLHKGEKRRICLSAAQAYGFYDLELVIDVARKKLPRGGAIQLGDRVMIESEQGEVKAFRVIEANGQSLKLDGNHPLAGQDLVFDIETVDARDATSEEIAESGTIVSASYLH